MRPSPSLTPIHRFHRLACACFVATLGVGCTLITDVDRTKIEEEVKVMPPPDEEDGGAETATDGGSEGSTPDAGPVTEDASTAPDAATSGASDGGDAAVSTNDGGNPTAPDAGRVPADSVGDAGSETTDPAAEAGAEHEMSDAGGREATLPDSAVDAAVSDAN